MPRNPGEPHDPTAVAADIAEGRLPLKGFHLREEEWSPWYKDDFGLLTKICWQRASDRSILIHNLAAAPDDPDPASHFVHVIYEVDLPTGRKSGFRIQGEFLDGLAAETRQHVLTTIERAISMAEGKQEAEGKQAAEGKQKASSRTSNEA